MPELCDFLVLGVVGDLVLEWSILQHHNIYKVGKFFVSDIPVGGIVGTASPVGACLGRHGRPVRGLCGGSPFCAFAPPRSHMAVA